MYCVKPELTHENVKQRVSSYHIFKLYCKNFKYLNQKFYSEFRDETEPSCCIGVINKDLMFKDFGTGESLRAVGYVMKKYNLTFPQALQKINQDFKLNLLSTVHIKNVKPIESSGVLQLKVPTLKESTGTILRIKRRDFREKDLKYWNSYYWTKEMLEKADIYSISHYWIKNIKGDRRFFTGNSLAFSLDYYWNEGTFRRKIYFPGTDGKKSKFISNVDTTIVQGVKLLPKEGGELLFITSSLKDCGIFWRLGYNAVAPNSEETFLPEKYFRKIEKRWKRIVIWYNNDWDKGTNPGVKSAKKYSKKYNLEYYYNPDNTPKDPSDYSKEYGIGEFDKLIKSKLYL